MSGERYEYDEEASALWHMDVVHEVVDENDEDDDGSQDQGWASTHSGGR